MTEPNWLVLMGLVYLGCGFIGYASAVGRGALLAGYSGTAASVAAAYQSYGVKFATLLALLGLVGLGAAQFETLSFGREVFYMFIGLMALLTVYVFAADYFAEPDVTAMRQAAAGASTFGDGASRSVGGPSYGGTDAGLQGRPVHLVKDEFGAAPHSGGPAAAAAAASG